MKDRTQKPGSVFSKRRFRFSFHYGRISNIDNILTGISCLPPLEAGSKRFSKKK